MIIVLCGWCECTKTIISFNFVSSFSFDPIDNCFNSWISWTKQKNWGKIPQESSFIWDNDGMFKFILPNRWLYQIHFDDQCWVIWNHTKWTEKINVFFVEEMKLLPGMIRYIICDWRSSWISCSSRTSCHQIFCKIKWKQQQQQCY